MTHGDALPRWRRLPLLTLGFKIARPKPTGDVTENTFMFYTVYDFIFHNQEHSRNNVKNLLVGLYAFSIGDDNSDCGYTCLNII